jgi:hypothetical protein
MCFKFLQKIGTQHFFCCKDCYIPFILLQRLVEKFMLATDKATAKTYSGNSTSSVKEQILHFKARACIKSDRGTQLKLLCRQNMIH